MGRPRFPVSPLSAFLASFPRQFCVGDSAAAVAVVMEAFRSLKFPERRTFVSDQRGCDSQEGGAFSLPLCPHFMSPDMGPGTYREYVAKWGKYSHTFLAIEPQKGTARNWKEPEVRKGIYNPCGSASKQNTVNYEADTSQVPRQPLDGVSGGQT